MGNSNKLAKYEHKCRRCKVVKTGDTVTVKVAHDMLELSMKATFVEVNPKPFYIHTCRDGGEGICDLIGYRVLNRLEDNPCVM